MSRNDKFHQDDQNVSMEISDELLDTVSGGAGNATFWCYGCNAKTTQNDTGRDRSWYKVYKCSVCGMENVNS